MPPIQAAAERLQQRVVALCQRHPFPSYSDKFRRASEEMCLKMRLLGMGEEDLCFSIIGRKLERLAAV